MTDHWHATSCSHCAGTTWTPCQVQSGMSGLPVTVRAGASLLGRWLLPRVWQHSALSVVSWRSNLRGAANTQQLRRQNFAAAEPRLWNSLSVQLCNPDITYGLFRRQLKGHLFREAWTQHSVTSDMRRLRKLLTYLLTYVLPFEDLGIKHAPDLCIPCTVQHTLLNCAHRCLNQPIVVTSVQLLGVTLQFHAPEQRDTASNVLLFLVHNTLQNWYTAL